ncbi:MAG: dockerin type I repeat-containing protein [Clostridia bacterium]|nr:dockerin type I repeat-containing protein [Clostridia bacterium]
MKKTIKMLKTIIMIAIILVISVPTVYATIYAVNDTNFSVILTAPNKVLRGGTIQVLLALDGFTDVGQGVNSFLADLEYDTTKLSITSSQIVAQNGWDTPTYENGKILTLKGSMVTSKETIMKMTFTVNPEAELGLTTIKVKNAEAANDENDFVGKDGSIDIEIEQDKLQVNISEYNVNANNFITNIALETPIREFVENIDTNGTIEIYKGTQKVTDTETNIGTGMTVKISFNNQEQEYTVVVKGDINGDGCAKLSDLSKLKLSVIGTTQLEGAYKEAADLNGDGNVKLSDLSKMKLYLVGKGTL